MEKLTEMKAEINKENKEKFFAQYWGQRLCLMPYKNREIMPFEALYYFYDEEISENSCLYLTSLSEISDEDAIQIALMDGCSEKSSEEFKISLGRCKVDKDHPLGKKVLSQLEADFLRSKGYALPWMGLTVEEIIEAGWIQLGQ